MAENYKNNESRSVHDIETDFGTAAVPRTKAIYQYDERARKHVTQITSITPVSALAASVRTLFKQASEQDLIITTAETIFYAQGGGQPSDTGHMRVIKSNNEATIEVVSVRSDANVQIFHLTNHRFEGSNPISIGDRVEQIIDSEKRDLNSRIHTAGHLVGLAVRHLADTIPDVVELKAQHYPDSAFVEFRGIIDTEHKESIQTKASVFVDQALRTKVYWWTEQKLREKCVVVPAAVVIPTDGLLRAVDIVGAGAYPCGGTHTADTSLVGKLNILKISSRKGVSKISYSIG